MAELLQKRVSIPRGLAATAAVIIALASNLSLWLHVVAGLFAQAFGETIPAHPSPKSCVIATAVIGGLAALTAFVSTTHGRRVDQVFTFLLSLFLPGLVIFMILLGCGVLWAKL